LSDNSSTYHRSSQDNSSTYHRSSQDNSSTNHISSQDNSSKYVLKRSIPNTLVKLKIKDLEESEAKKEYIRLKDNNKISNDTIRLSSSSGPSNSQNNVLLNDSISGGTSLNSNSVGASSNFSSTNAIRSNKQSSSSNSLSSSISNSKQSSGNSSSSSSIKNDIRSQNTNQSSSYTNQFDKSNQSGSNSQSDSHISQSDPVEISSKINCQLEIILDTGTVSLIGEKSKIEDFYESFHTISYKFTKNDENTNLDEELIEFYVKTESFEELKKYFKKNGITNYKDKTIFKNDEMSSNEMFIEKLAEGLEDINKIQSFETFLEDVFSFLELFCKNLQNFYKKQNFPKRSLILLIEKLVSQTLKFLNARISRHTFSSKNELKEKLVSRLEFLNLNFKYLILEDNYNFNRTAGENVIRRDKEKIMLEIDNYLSSR
jgi:hypothetical protein